MEIGARRDSIIYGQGREKRKRKMNRRRPQKDASGFYCEGVCCAIGIKICLNFHVFCGNIHKNSMHNILL